jgi:phytoene dehydrogenase-like protein
MNKNILIIGAGIGGLSAAIRLVSLGHKVRILEAREKAGGLASGFRAGDFIFDSGPYILLDKPGLQWAFERLDLDMDALKLIPIENIYHVLDEDGSSTAFNRSINDTAAGFEKQFKGSAAQYSEYVKHTFKIHQKLKPLTFKTHPNPLDVLLSGSLQYVPFLLSSLDRVLKSSGLPQQLRKAISIWTHIAGQPVEEAPAPMAFVPGLFHNIGSFYPAGGMHSIAELLTEAALKAGVEISYNTRASSIKTSGKKVKGVVTIKGDFMEADAVISNSNGIGTYTELLEDLPAAEKKKFEKLPLQSPGMCVYMAVNGKNPPYYIRFKLKGQGCVAFVQPGLMEPALEKDGWFPARLIAPLDHARAAALGAEGQMQLMNEMLKDGWWQNGISEYKVLHKRTTFEWGREFNLYHDSMNPVMTAKFMLKGRIAHRSPYVKGLYLTGSSTHPGQWVSFCAISGVLAADCLHKDLAHA